MPPTDMNEPLHNTWGQSTPEGAVRRLTLPSGSQCDAERCGLQGLVLAGVLAEGDSLTALVDKKHLRRVRGGKSADHVEINAESLMDDSENLGKVLMVVDRCMPHIIKSPKVLIHFNDLDDVPAGQPSTRRIPEDERNDGSIYTDQVPLEDKMFLFNWAVGGVGDAERFRGESRAAVAGLENGEGVRYKAKRSGRRKK
jgi:hypothetical protein